MASLDELLHDPCALDDYDEARSEADADEASVASLRQPAAARRSRPFLGDYLALLPPDIKICIGDAAHELSKGATGGRDARSSINWQSITD